VGGRKGKKNEKRKRRGGKSMTKDGGEDRLKQDDNR